MRSAALLFALVLAPLSVHAMGFTEDPQEKLTKTFVLEAVKSLEIRGEIDFDLVPGPVPQVIVVTTRALFDQLTVSNWWGAATVAIESGLRGPRERGSVKATITLPSLDSLSVFDRSHGRGVWPSTWGTLKVSDKSTLDFVLEGTNFSLETSWLTKVTLGGRVSRFRADLRHESRVDATSLDCGETEIAADEGSVFEAGRTGSGTGSARHESLITVDAAEPWQALLLREGSQVEVRTRSRRRRTGQTVA